MLSVAEIEGKILFPLGDLLASAPLPNFLVDVQQAVQDAADNAFYTEALVQPVENGLDCKIVLVLPEEIALPLPGLDVLSLVLGGGDGVTVLNAEVSIYAERSLPAFRASLREFPVALRISAEVLRPLLPGTSEPDLDVQSLTLPLGVIDLEINSEGDVNVSLGEGGLSIPRCMIGRSSVIISASDVLLRFSGDQVLPDAAIAAGLDPDWRGLFISKAVIELVQGLNDAVPEDLTFENCFIGSGGFSGSVAVDWNPSLTGNLAGIMLTLNHLGLTFVQNAFTRSEIQGQIRLPFFDEPLDVEIGINLDGGFTIGLASTNGLYTLTKPYIFSLELDGISFEVQNDVFTAKLGGTLTILFGQNTGLEWPSFQVKELIIDSEGNVHLEGGWLDLPNQYSLDFYGFQLEITKLGFGKTEDGGKWIGFSGTLKLVDGLTAGASVEGLRIIWYDDGRPSKFTFNGIGVEFEIPDVLRFKGAVTYQADKRFDGAIKLELLALNLEIDGQLVVGRHPQSGEMYFAVYLGIELPAGIPLFATGLGLYGIAGLYAQQMEPDKQDQEQWYSIDGQNSWYHRGTLGVAELTKWKYEPASLALGAGVTIGTVYDNGFTLSGRFLLVIVFPGPILLIEGKANLLRERASLSEEALFRALAVLDGREGTFLIGLDAQYQFGSGGELIDLQAGAEAFFSLSDASAWHLYIGEQEPREKRVRAAICFHIFEANAYFMLDARQLAFGAWIGHTLDWEAGPVELTLEAWIEGNVILSWKPVHVHGDYGLHGRVELTVFGIGFGIGVSADLALDVFDPFHLLAEFNIEVKTPWPLPDVEVGVTLEWGPDPIPPPLPVPLKEIAVEHLKVTTSWPLLLAPNYDRGDGFLVESAPAFNPDELTDEQRANMPVVPLDCRPHITFGRAVWDDAMVGGNPQPPNPAEERIGDPVKNEGPVLVRYGLQGVALHKWDSQNNRWMPVARKGIPGLQDDGDPVEREIFGSWAPVPAMPDGGGTAVNQVKLWLWSKTPFDYTRHSGRAWDEWFTDRFTQYPCVPPARERVICCDFQSIKPASRFQSSSWQCPAEPQIILSWLGDPPTIEVHNTPLEGLTHWLCLHNLYIVDPIQPPRKNEVTIDFVVPVESVRIIVVDEEGVTARWYDTKGQVGSRFQGGLRNNPYLEITGQDLVRVVLSGYAGYSFILKICAVIPPDSAEVAQREVMSQHLIDEIARWQDEDAVLEPYTDYRLTVTTTVDARGAGELAGWTATPNPLAQTCFAFFQTGGPPGLTRLLPPPGHPTPENFASGLDDLTGYVRQTIPATVPAPGEKPLLPRPVYRAYDVGVEFNENYANLMYRLGRRDLGLYLYDNNNQPVRDAEGRLIILSNRWGTTEALNLTESETLFIKAVNASDCASVDPTTVSRDKTLTSAIEGQVLDPDTVYEARLVPLLLHEDFTTYPAGTFIDADLQQPRQDGWEVRDEGTNTVGHWEMHGHETFTGIVVAISGTLVTLDLADLSRLDTDFDVLILADDTARPSRTYRIMRFDNTAKTVTVDGEPNLAGGTSAWEIPKWGAIVQTTDSWDSTHDSGPDPVKPGTMLLLTHHQGNQPSNWTDYRLSVLMRTKSHSEGTIGLVFRYYQDDHYYRFSMDRERKYRRLVRVVAGTHTILAEDDFVYRQDQDYLITVEAIGSSLRVYQDGVLVFAVTDESFGDGTVGLYCFHNRGARFSDVRVDDFRAEAPIAYRFKFTTSRFANFFHHLHSFQDKNWAKPLSTGTNPDTTAAVALNEFSSVPSDQEIRAYEALATAVLGSAVHQNPPQVEVTRIIQETDNHTLALLVQSPEPIDWKRTSLQLCHTGRAMMAPALPGTVKLTDVSFANTQPNQESVTILLRETAELTQQRIEYRRLPGPLAEPTGDPVLFVDEFEDTDRGLLFQEKFGPNALDHYEIVAEGTQLGPPAWGVLDNHIVQTSEIYGRAVMAEAATKPGTLALTGQSAWGNIRIKAILRSERNATIGVVFRYRDSDNYYRFSMHQEPPPRQPLPLAVMRKGFLNYRRLIKKSRRGSESVIEVLWEDHVAYTRGRSYQLVIETFDGWLLGYLDDTLLFVVNDLESPIATGRVGLYCWKNSGAHFEGLEVESLEVPLVLWKPAFTDTNELQIVDEAGAVFGPSQWAAANGVVTQSSGIHVIDNTYHLPGTYAVGGNVTWRDVEVSVRLGSDDGDAIGVMFRYQDSDNYYRFSMDRQHSYRRLVRKKNGTVTLLWDDAVPYEVGRMYGLTLRAVGSELTGYLDGTPLFMRTDPDPILQGQVALYCWADYGARFESLIVADRTRRLGPWTIRDDVNTSEGPSVWKLSGGALQQTSNINGSVPSTSSAFGDLLGTLAIAGNSDWQDYRVTVKMRSDNGHAMGVVFRYVDEANYYRLLLDGNGNYRQLAKRENGVLQQLWLDIGNSYALGEPFTLTIDVIGPRIVAYLNDARIFAETGGTPTAGQVGLYCHASPGARFERIEVRRLPLEAYALLRDRFADGDTSDWDFVNEGTSGTPNWGISEGSLQQTGDSDGTYAINRQLAFSDALISVRLASSKGGRMGLIFYYTDADHYYRFSLDNQQQLRLFEKKLPGQPVQRLWENHSGYEVGQSYELTIIAIDGLLRGYINDVPAFVVEDEDLSTGYIGLYCSGNEGVRFSPVRVYPARVAYDEWMLDESFDFPIPGRWSFIDEQGPTSLLEPIPFPPPTSHWEVIGGELRQTGNYYSGSTRVGAVHKPGTYAIAGSGSWADYRLSVRLRSGTGGAIGAVFRYQDEDNYYRFSMDQQLGYLRVIKKIGGTVSEIWVAGNGYDPSLEYIFTVDCIGDRLIGYLNGVQLFSLADGDLASGRVGLYCWNNAAARFLEVRVAAPIWTPYYTFGREARLPAGTRVQVYGGSLGDAIRDALPEGPGVLRRFAAALGESGQIRLAGDGVDLRIAGSNKSSGHARTFLPESAYQPIEAQALRKADGTGFFLLLPDGAPFEAGQYRLIMQYRRDNRTLDHDSLVFSEVGNNASEGVIIDSPGDT